MPIGVPESKNNLFKRSSLWLKNDDTDMKDYSGNGYPKKLHIELSTKCNLRCQHCGRRYITQPCQDEIMSQQMIDAIAKDFFNKLSAIRIGGSSYGDPMVSPYFNYFLEKLKGHAIDVELTTNATLITRDSADLIAAVVSALCISVEGIGKNYEANRGQKWSKLENIINLLVKERNKSKRAKPLIISFEIAVKREFRNDCFKLVKFAKEHQMDLLSLRNFFPGPGEYTSSPFYYEKEHNRFYDEVEQYANSLGIPVFRPPAIPQEKLKRKTFTRQQCNQPFEAFGILPNGKIFSCCAGPVDLGFYSPGEKNVRESWLSKEYIHLRKTVNSEKPLDNCRICETYNYNPLAYIKPLTWCQKLNCLFRKYPPS